MRVQDLFEQLSYGELSSLSIGMEGAGDIAPDKQDMVITQINAALKAIYTRFLHRRDFIEVAAVAGQRRYQVAPTEGLIKILSVVRKDDPATDRDECLVLGLNSRNSSHGVQILTHDSFQLPAPQAGELYEVEYQAGHTKLTALADEITVMPALEEALLCKVAASIFSGMNGEGHRSKAQELMGRYEQLCSEAQMEDMAQESGDDEFDRLRDRGFV